MEIMGLSKFTILMGSWGVPSSLNKVWFQRREAEFRETCPSGENNYVLQTQGLAKTKRRFPGCVNACIDTLMFQ